MTGADRKTLQNPSFPPKAFGMFDFEPAFAVYYSTASASVSKAVGMASDISHFMASRLFHLTTDTMIAVRPGCQSHSEGTSFVSQNSGAERPANVTRETAAAAGEFSIPHQSSLSYRFPNRHARHEKSLLSALICLRGRQDNRIKIRICPAVSSCCSLLPRTANYPHPE